jgi:hypothetical protein
MATSIRQKPIRWLPASWTVCLLAAFLVITAFVNKHVPESYMVSLKVSVSLPPLTPCIN